MLKDYYYTDKEELDALRVENAKLRANITTLVTKLANLEAKYKKGGKGNGKAKNNESGA